MDSNKIKEVAKSYEKDMTRFLREIVKHPGESAGEKAHIEVIKKEMEKVGFDEITIDPQGNIIGYMGTGDRIIAYDAHIDTVGLGNMDNWKFDPYVGYENETEIGGRGVSDQLGGIVSSVYGAKIMKDLNLIPKGVKIMVVGSVQEEDCDGLCWHYIINEDKIRPEFVISTEPTDGGIYRGHRGRMEIKISIHGVSCHGSAPERGDNAAYKAAEIMMDVKKLNENSAEDPYIKGLVKMLDEKYNKYAKAAQFLGRGTVCVSQVFYTSPSRCAVVDSMTISLDRRMTAGETWEYCLEEIRQLPSVKKYGKDVVVSLYEYDTPSYTGCVYPIECYFPTWWIEPEDPLCVAMVKTHKELYGDKRTGKSETNPERQQRPLLDKWTFSTNGVTIMGRNGIKCIGFGPGAESQAHAPNEKTWKADLIVNAAFYAALPTNYCQQNQVTLYKAPSTPKYYFNLNKIQMKTPLVEMDGDEMTRILWAWIKEILICPYVDLKTEYYDLGLEYREKTHDQVTIDSANATKKYGVAVKCATITPNAARVKEYNLTEMYKSPNGTIRAILDGTIFRAPILVKGIVPYIPTWTKPITIARHSYGDVYKDTEAKVKQGSKAELVITDKNGKKDSQTIFEFKDSDGIVQGLYNKNNSIEGFARSCFNYAISTKQTLWFATKDTISKKYDHTFKDIFADIFKKDYEKKFNELGIEYFYTLIDDAVARVVRSNGGMIWACKNYDGDVFSDMVSTAYGSLAMMTSVLVSPTGYYEYEAAHGTVQKHYYKYLKGEETSSNSVATIFAWSGAFRKRGELDNLPELIKFADNLEKATIQTIEDGIMTGDLYLISKLPNKTKVESKAFIKAIKDRLAKLMGN